MKVVALLATLAAADDVPALSQPEKMCLGYWEESFGADSVVGKLEVNPPNGEGLFPDAISACSACFHYVTQTRHTGTITGSPCRVLDSSQVEAATTYRTSGSEAGVAEGDGATATHDAATFSAFTYTTFEIPEGRLCRHVVKEVSQGGGKDEFLRQYHASLGAELSEAQKVRQTSTIGVEAWNQKMAGQCAQNFVMCDGRSSFEGCNVDRSDASPQGFCNDEEEGDNCISTSMIQPDAWDMASVSAATDELNTLT